jgi:hypothetical protein
MRELLGRASARSRGKRFVMAILKGFDWRAVKHHYDKRAGISNQLQHLHEQRNVSDFAQLAVGLSDFHANYSASEGHRPLGPYILGSNTNAERRLFELAENFTVLADAHKIPEIIRAARIKYLFIGVGSEISCMMNPRICWVANRRTIWTHLVIKHADDIAKADAELELYKDSNETSEMAYNKWAAIHGELSVALTRIAEESRSLSKKSKIPAGEISFLWADAIASHLYGLHHSQPQRERVDA